MSWVGGVLRGIVGLLTGSGGISAVLAEIQRTITGLADARVRLAQATEETERARLGAEVEGLRATLEAQQALIAQKQARTGIIGLLLILPTIGMGLSLMLYIGKILVWDKVLGLGRTDPLTGDVRDWATVILGGFFATGGLIGGAAYVAGRLRR